MKRTIQKLPIGIENFEKLRQDDFYYIDKTGLIREIIQNWSEVTLFTRPRRFGKSLNMSMLKSFFSVKGDKQIFEGLEIAREKELCEIYMGKFPVVLISLKEISAASYDTAYRLAVGMINEAAAGLEELSGSSRLSKEDREAFRRLRRLDMEEPEFLGSLRLISRLLYRHYGQRVIILIDEYDVPLAKASENGYYDKMVNLMRGFLGQALKSNENLMFAVLTGCMRISKESIFTGLNNFNVLSVADVEFDEYFGFTDAEVRQLLQDYDLSGHYEDIREWYDGYQFGNAEVYCPWDVICHCRKLCLDPQISPQNYWINTSSNEVVRKFIQSSENRTTKREIERLIAGEEIVKEIHQELTYKDMYASIENIWSVLFMTGYLTQRGKPDGTFFRLAIPNMEIRNIFTSQIMSFFQETVKKDGVTLERFCYALEHGDAGAAEECFTAYLKKTISIRDTFARKKTKENFYHGMLLGILGLKENWVVSSNREMGEGYSDILVETDSDRGMILEIKYAHNENLAQACQEALNQIEIRHYADELRDEGIEKIYKYGIACYLKKCRVVVEEQER